MAIDSSDNVYVVDSSNNRIQKFDSNGVYITKWGSFGTSNGTFSTPSGIVIDSSDNIYVSDSGNNRIQKFDTSGNYVSKWGSGGTDNDEFNSPQGLGVDSSGNIYVADYSNHRIQKFANSSSATFSSSLTGLTCGTTYHFRSYSTNSVSTGYSSDATFTTSNCPVVSSGGGGGGGGSYIPLITNSIATNEVVTNNTKKEEIKDTNPKEKEVKLEIKNDTVKILSQSPNLSFGQNNKNVKVLQQFLNANGYTVAKSGPGSIGNETNYFGLATKKAVIAFQKANKISTTGTVGPLTRNAIAKTKTEKIPCTSQIATTKTDSASCPI